MALNFCSARLKTNISCSAVSSEGYDVANLLSGVPTLQSKGFLAEGFCKPPVSIILKFFCSVDINHIMLWVEVGCQKSNGIELLAAADCDLYGDKSVRDAPSRSSSSDVKVRIGSCRINHELGVAFHVYNGRVSPKVPTNFASRHFHTSAATVIRNCRELEVKIFSTANSSVPSLKKIEVWGQPGRRCSEEVKRKLYSLWNGPTGNDESVPVIVVPQSETGKSPDTPSTSSDLCEQSVPEEFLDPITFNFMAIPMTLPCGKAVDLSTLEKFENVEANWGRGPSDPFTGVPFSQSVFPVPDAALKSRIDQFLVENGHLSQFKGVGRTVGRGKRELNQFAATPNKCSQISGGNQLSDGASSSRSQNHLSNVHYPITSNRSHVPEHCSTSSEPGTGGINVKYVGETHKKLVGTNAQVHRGLKRKGNNDLPSFPPKKSVDSRMNNHEDDVEDSLDSALQSVLTGLPSFVNSTAHAIGEASEKTPVSECSHCRSKESLFTLPCRHLLCRACLVNKSSDHSGKRDCEVCHNQYNSSDVIRFHSS